MKATVIVEVALTQGKKPDDAARAIARALSKAKIPGMTVGRVGNGELSDIFDPDQLYLWLLGRPPHGAGC